SDLSNGLYQYEFVFNASLVAPEPYLLPVCASETERCSPDAARKGRFYTRTGRPTQKIVGNLASFGAVSFTGLHQSTFSEGYYLTVADNHMVKNPDIDQSQGPFRPAGHG